ncbi:hypothetical protein H5410_022551 [Solanum commersonii]|uniref:Cytochrome P450 n=1 Tax=Solanum commersonii TaxID=4109 RepID=A0A9J5ZJF8_SOLCO|nr:hypothetical protein H5410_022551 [Solanum commersonii]
MCAGIDMAERMFMYSLASLIHSFDWKFPEGETLDLTEKFGIILKKKMPLVAISTPRLTNPTLHVVTDITELLDTSNISNFYPGLASSICRNAEMGTVVGQESKDFLQVLLKLKDESDAKMPLTMIALLMKDASIWKNPTEFHPERFLDNKWDYSGNDFNYFLFRSGRRICAGIAMAERMFMYSLAPLIHSFNWKLREGETSDLTEKFGITLKKKIPLVAIPTPTLYE